MLKVDQYKVLEFLSGKGYDVLDFFISNENEEFKIEYKSGDLYFIFKPYEANQRLFKCSGVEFITRKREVITFSENFKSLNKNLDDPFSDWLKNHLDLYIEEQKLPDPWNAYLKNFDYPPNTKPKERGHVETVEIIRDGEFTSEEKEVISEIIKSDFETKAIELLQHFQEQGKLNGEQLKYLSPIILQTSDRINELSKKNFASGVAVYLLQKCADKGIDMLIAYGLLTLFAETVKYIVNTHLIK